MGESARSMSAATQPNPAAGSSTQTIESGKGQAETLASEEVIELQAFLERREWIEDKIRVRSYGVQLLEISTVHASCWRRCHL